MMKRCTLLSLPLITGVIISGCGSDEVSFTTQEDSRRQALENAEYNARSWRDTNAPDLKILMRGDSTIGPSCAQGDGWASVDLTDGSSTKSIIQLKCSTVSGTVGCLEQSDFQSKPFAKEDGRCNTKLPLPLPKIIK